MSSIDKVELIRLLGLTFNIKISRIARIQLLINTNCIDVFCVFLMRSLKLSLAHVISHGRYLE